MKTVEVSRVTDIPSEIIWDEMKHFDRVLRWVPGGNESSISVKGKGVGATRDINLITQGYVQHELVAYSDKDLSFSICNSFFKRFISSSRLITLKRVSTSFTRS